MINLSNISRTFHKGQSNEIVALRNINMQIENGEFVMLIGENGSGKSTLLNTIAGSCSPTSGIISIDGVTVTKMPEYKRSKWIARVFQNPLHGTAPDLNILENFRLAAIRNSTKHLKIGLGKIFIRQVQDKIATLGMGLENRLYQSMGSLSGGQRQALSLLMCVMTDLKVLLLDEPTAALDPRSAETVMKTADKLIKEYHITAVMVTHNIKDAYHYGNRLIQMAEGEIIRDVRGEEKQQLNPADVYGWFIGDVSSQPYMPQDGA